MLKLVRSCHYCNAEILKDGVGLNKKLFELDTSKDVFLCLPCMASVLECTVEDLTDKVASFKEDGCKQFS